MIRAHIIHGDLYCLRCIFALHQLLFQFRFRIIHPRQQMHRPQLRSFDQNLFKDFLKSLRRKLSVLFQSITESSPLYNIKASGSSVTTRYFAFVTGTISVILILPHPVYLSVHRLLHPLLLRYPAVRLHPVRNVLLPGVRSLLRSPDSLSGRSLHSLFPGRSCRHCRRTMHRSSGRYSRFTARSRISPLFGDSLSEHDIKFCFFKRRCQSYSSRPLTRVRLPITSPPCFDRLGSSDIHTHGSVELKGTSTGGCLRITEHDTDLFHAAG